MSGLQHTRKLKCTKMAAKKPLHPNRPADQNASYDLLAKENRRLTALNADLQSQLVTMRKSRTISSEEEAGIKTLREEYHRINYDINQISLWLRNNKATEIKQGRHMGMTLSEIVIMYMAKGLDK